MRLRSQNIAVVVACATWTAAGYSNNTASTLSLQSPFYQLDDSRPPGCPDCPRCFDCHYDEFSCQQFAKCNSNNGKCSCPPGFGGDDCSAPLCGSLADSKNRSPREGDVCDCDEGWEGINCNVCSSNQACNALMPEGEGGVCYKQGLVVKENFQMCNVTNQAILKQVAPRIPQVTFSCNADEATCNFQFWVDQKESFYCALDTCSWEAHDYDDRNTTKYQCEHIQCSCIEGRFLCGEEGSINIDEFLTHEIKGPASFASQQTEGGSLKDGSRFEEPAMNNLISQFFGDEFIQLKCRAGECLYQTEVPGWTRPVKEINTPLIASVIAGSALFVVFVILLVWYLSRRAALKRSYGAIRLGEDFDEEISRMMASHKPMALQFENISYSLNGKQILSDITGIAHPGQVMAVMGASGAGKSTFLDILARKNKRGVSGGNTYVNGERIIDQEFRNVVGFVDQEDTLLSTLTVHETILTSALLRLPADMGRGLKEQRVVEVMQQLGIYNIKDQMIGSEEGNGRGISGGEKRRVGIACELVTSPSILFLDEPTSGLDAFNAFNVIECLVTLAKTYNRTVVFTIHQPRSNIVALFDQLVLLAKGRTVYSGPFSNCQAYFDHIGYTCPPGFNIADYLVDLTMHASVPRSPSSINIRRDSLDGDGLMTGSSSTRAVKSIRSTSNMSVERLSTPESAIRPKGRRRQSLKQKQDRQLFTRRRTGEDDTPPTPKTDEEDNAASLTGSMRSWLKMSKQSGVVPPQILENPDDLPPDANTDLDVLVSSFRASDVAKTTREEIANAARDAVSANGHVANPRDGPSIAGSLKSYRRISLPRQFLILSMRTWRNLYRNPMLMLTHYAIAILLAVLSGWLFYGLTDDIGGMQNRLGLFFFILALFGFSTLTSLTVFSSERLLFVRERANGYYSPITYFAAKVVFDIVPLRLIPPIIMGIIIYPMCGLLPAWGVFFKFILVLVLFNLAAAAICLFVGIVFKEPGVANLIGSLVMLFSLLFAGLLLNHDAIPAAARWLQSVSQSHALFRVHRLISAAINLPLCLRSSDRQRSHHAAPDRPPLRARYRSTRCQYIERIRIRQSCFVDRCHWARNILRSIHYHCIWSHAHPAG
jgi:ABC-type multidrug transport system ATPase subunit